jgi:hypothetical protein
MVNSERRAFHDAACINTTHVLTGNGGFPKKAIRSEYKVLPFTIHESLFTKIEMRVLLG